MSPSSRSVAETWRAATLRLLSLAGRSGNFEYQELQLRIAERQAEWEAYLAEVRRLAEETSGAMAAAEGATYTFAEGDMSEEVEAQVDYWSEGALTDFRNRLEGHLERLGDPEELSTEELKQMLDEIAPMENELSDIVERAKERPSPVAGAPEYRRLDLGLVRGDALGTGRLHLRARGLPQGLALKTEESRARRDRRERHAGRDLWRRCNLKCRDQLFRPLERRSLAAGASTGYAQKYAYRGRPSRLV